MSPMSRRSLLVTSAAAGVGFAALGDTNLAASTTLGGTNMGVTTEWAEGQAIRPFTYKATDTELLDLRKRIAATRWPDKETVNDRTQGAQLAKVQESQDWVFLHIPSKRGNKSILPRRTQKVF